MNDLKNALNGGKPMLINPVYAAAYTKKLDTHQVYGMDILTALFGEMPKPYKVGSVGVVPIVGVMGKGLSPIEKALGASDVDDVAYAISNFCKDKKCKSIMLDISSPGGSVAGIPELANVVREASAKKNVIAFSDTECASAAYWVGSQANQFICTPSAAIGSIGVYMVIPDATKAYEMEGIKMNVIKAGKYKAAGVAGTSLTAEQRGIMQDEVDELHASFKADVMSVRMFAEERSMEGQVFNGRNAAAKGLATGLARSKTEVIEKLDSEGSEDSEKEDSPASNEEVEQENEGETKYVAKEDSGRENDSEDSDDDEDEDEEE